jgi:hypothetical protein
MYEIEIKGLDEHLRKLNAYGEIADRELGTAMQQSVIAVESAVRPLVPVGVSGALRQSIASEVKREGAGGSIVGRIFSSIDSPYPAVMEFGRRPGAAMPPPQALERWVHLKLGVPDELAAGVAFTVARSIARKGIAGRRFMQQGFEKAKSQVDQFFARALERIAKALAVK